MIFFFFLVKNIDKIYSKTLKEKYIYGIIDLSFLVLKIFCIYITWTNLSVSRFSVDFL
uniref:Uncharacterized protein n=1 Tax=Solanum lycopersicum TaxID=4081 RepID=A0A3Q7FDR7_SOLLC